MVLHPTSSRTLISDGLVGFAAAEISIGFLSDTELLPAKYKSKTDRFYSQLFRLPQHINFEFERNRYFFSQVLQETIPLNAPKLVVDKRDGKQNIIIFPGAGYVKRNWSIDNFVRLVGLVLNRTSYDIIIAGSDSDNDLGSLLSDKYRNYNRFNNLIGQTTLPEIIGLVAGAKLVIANETSAIHIAAACRTESICILGGGHYKRFAPYPRHHSCQPKCVYEKLPCFSCNWNCVYQTKDSEPYPCVSANTVDKVWEYFTNLEKSFPNPFNLTT